MSIKVMKSTFHALPEVAIALPIFTILLITVALSGCASSPIGQPATDGNRLKGFIRGGQQPISGATVSMISAGTSGYGVAGAVLATTTTGPTGDFAFANLPTCPTNGVLVYLQSSGGDPGSGYNPFAAEAVVLGPCGELTTSTFINVTEVTTIAAAYALAPFASFSAGLTNIGSSAGNLIGLKNAAGSSDILADKSSGTAHTANVSGGMIPPAAEVNTLANILASCVNTVGSGSCAALFAAATPPGGLVPTDTFQAAIDIALNPGINTGVLFGLSVASPPFLPALTAAPTDFVLGIRYTGGPLAVLGAAHGIDVDALGNVWLACGNNTSSSPNGSIVEISPRGMYLSPSAGYLNTSLNLPEVLAVNSSANVEVASLRNSEVLEIGEAGANNSPFSVSGASSIAGPVGIAIDNRDLSSWVTDSVTNQLTHISATGTEIALNSPQSTGSTPLGVAIDGSGTIWVANSDMNSQSGAASSLSRYTPNGNGTYRTAAFSTGPGSYPFDLAIDYEGNVWSAQYAGIGKNSADGTLISPTGGFTSNSDNSPFTLAIDGQGRVFAANSSLNYPAQRGTITVFQNDGALISKSNFDYGYSANGTLPINMFGPRGIALDGSGNVWVSGGEGTPVLVELVGLAAPVLTPLSAANSPNKLGTKP